MPPPGDQIFNLCLNWENWEVKYFIFTLSSPLLKLNSVFSLSLVLKRFYYEDDHLLGPWSNSQPLSLLNILVFVVEEHHSG